MDLFTPLERVLPAVGKKAYEAVKGVILIQKSEDKLREEMDDLQRLRVDAENRVKDEVERGNVKYSEKFLGWRKRVDDLNDSVWEELHGEAKKASKGGRNDPAEEEEEEEEQMHPSSSDSRPCFLEKCSPCSLPSAVHHSWCVADMIEKAGKLKKEQLNSSDITILNTGNPVGCGPRIFGSQEESLKEILDLLRRDDDKGIIGIYGLGGVGKSTILEKIRYEFNREPSRFSKVVFAEVSRKMDIPKLRSFIANEWGVPDPDSMDADSLRKIIAKGKPLLLLLDGVWEEFTLRELGIPYPDSENKSKVVITTRSNKICSQMSAHPIKVNVLEAEDAKKLFKQHLKEKIRSSRRFAPLIDEVVSECGGLPLALITVGKTMASKETLQDWYDAKEWLMNSPKKLEGMEPDVFRPLKFSYDHLTDDECLKSCLLYCALFPDKFDINKEEIIEYWIGEGFLDRQKDGRLSEARPAGRQLLGKLVDSCLLEKGNDEEKQVRMHDVIRDMALWIKEKEFVVRNESTSTGRTRDETSWAEDAERISLMLTNIATLPKDPKCPKLTTLLLNGNVNLEVIPKKLFDFMEALRVLDLSNTGIRELPEGIGKLGNLHYLNVSNTPILLLSAEVGNLVNLRQLNLSSTLHLKRIPRKAISTLSKLRSLYVFNSCYNSWKQDDADQEKMVCFEDLDKLPQLEELGLDIKEPHTLRILYSNSYMSGSIVCLYLTGQEGLAPDELTIALQKMNVLREISVSDIKGSGELEFSGICLEKLEILKLVNLPNLNIIWRKVENLKCCLVHLNISECHALENVSWVQYFLSLQTISLSFCNGLKDLIPQKSVTEDGITFERLREITLNGLPKLESICWKSVELSSQEILIRVSNCPKLKKLPFRNEDVKNIKEVSGQQQWWDDLQWETNAIKPKFRPNQKS